MIERIKNPEYIGKNRCIFCTVVNVVLAVLGTVLVAGISIPLAFVFLLVSVASIGLRGYLVPGTPRLTKRYFPEWLLSKFDRETYPTVDAQSEFTPEDVLLGAEIIESCEDFDDLCLNSDFEDSWYETMGSIGDDQTVREEVAEKLGTPPENVTLETHGDAYVAFSDAGRIGQWESRTALLIDLASAEVLSDRIATWESFAPRYRSQMVGGLRIFCNTCPSCGGDILTGEEVVESCCQSKTVLELRCTDCEDRLLELPQKDVTV